jgi:dolichyl-phosphate beta-glucosyltransferase
MPPKLSVVIPAYNEADAIRAGKLAQAAQWLRSQSFESELIVVDDGSQDETVRLAQADAERVLEIEHAGKAAAIEAGMRAAAGEWVLFTDMDQATPISETPKLLRHLEQGADAAIGSRGLTRPGAPPGRYVLSWGQMALRSLLLGVSFTDTQCGFKAFTRAAAIDMLDHMQVYSAARRAYLRGASVTSGFDVELLFVGQRLGYRIIEVPVAWDYQQTRRVRLARDAWRGVVDLLRIAWVRLMRGYVRR